MAAAGRDGILVPCQRRALEGLLAAVRAGVPVVELRSPPNRGHGVTTVLRQLVAQLAPKAELISISVSLGADHPEKVIFEQASEKLLVGNVVVIDDVDVAARPQRLRASRNAGDEFRGAGSLAFEDASEPVRLLKALGDQANNVGGTVVFSTVEEGHCRFVQEPFVVRLDAARAEDIVTVISKLSPHLDSSEVLRRLSVMPSMSEIISAWHRARCNAGNAEITPAGFAQAARANIGRERAVTVDQVEQIDLAELPGMKKIQECLETHVLYPILHPDEARQQGLLPKRGVLLHGPPGTGKTTVGRALARRLQGRFFMIRELLLYKDIIEVFAQARAAAPSIVFFDDIDVLLGGWNAITEGARGHDLTRFLLSQMDGLCTTQEAQVIVVMAAADAKFLPPAILRSGRIELWLKMEKPKPRERKAILQTYISKAQAAVSDSAASALLREPLEIDEVSQACDDMVPADLRRLVSDARLAAAADGAKKSGGSYLKDAAMDLRRMKEEVDGILGRRMYT